MRLLRCELGNGSLSVLFRHDVSRGKFCPNCGAKAERTEIAAADQQLCPRCQANMTAVTLGGSKLRECPRCEGLWVDAATLEQICAEREKQAAILSVSAASPEAVAEMERNIRYLPCPVCHKLMNRVNFAHCSHVIVDVCKPHGTWFDKDELRRAVEFIRAGGLEKARAKELADIEEQRQKLHAERQASPGFSDGMLPGSISYDSDAAGTTVNGIADLLFSLLRR